MKKVIFLCFLLLLSACGNNFTKEEKQLLENYGISENQLNDCQNPSSIKVMLKGNFDKELVNDYCRFIIEDDKGVNTMIKEGLGEEEIKEYQSIPYMKAENMERYIAYDAPTIKEKVLNVNMNMDLDPFEITNIIEDDSDYTLLVNKFNALKEGYLPADLVEVKNYVCVQGEDYSCSTMDKMLLRKDAAKAYEQFAMDALKENINIRAIATYRSYEYQRMLYDYNLSIYGKEETDKYYARPGQSEHNSGLAVDITFNGHTYTDIEDKDGYEWILNNMHKYGFILRYPKDKVHITRYGYESWHIRYVGIDAAKEIYENNLTLEEYKAMQ